MGYLLRERVAVGFMAGSFDDRRSRLGNLASDDTETHEGWE
jgi:hypothetical protein